MEYVYSKEKLINARSQIKIYHLLKLRTALYRSLKDSQSSGKSTRAKATFQKVQQCLNYLDCLIGKDNDINLLQILSSGNIKNFRVLQESSTNSKKLSVSTTNAHINRIISCCRSAMKQGLLPNIAILRPNYGLQDREIKTLPKIDSVSDLNILIDSFYSNYNKLRKKPDLHPEQLHTLQVGIVLLGILLGGIGYKSVTVLLQQYDGSDELYLHHFKTKIKVSDGLIILIRDIWDLSKKTEGKDFLDVSNQSISSVINRYKGLKFPQRFSEPFVTWLSISESYGMSIFEQRELIDLIYQGVNWQENIKQAKVQKAINYSAKITDELKQNWYCIKCNNNRHTTKSITDLSRRLSGTILLNYLEKHFNNLPRPIEWYAPYDPEVTEINGKKLIRNKRLLDQLLFFKANKKLTDEINRLLLAKKYGFIYGHISEGKLIFSQIPQKEIDCLKSFISFNDSKRFTIETQSLKDIKGQKVKVIYGPYKGYEGEIFDVSNKANSAGLETAKSIFAIRVKGICAIATLNIDSSFVERILD